MKNGKKIKRFESADEIMKTYFPQDEQNITDTYYEPQSLGKHFADEALKKIKIKIKYSY